MEIGLLYTLAPSLGALEYPTCLTCRQMKFSRIGRLGSLPTAYCRSFPHKRSSVGLTTESVARMSALLEKQFAILSQLQERHHHSEESSLLPHVSCIYVSIAVVEE